MKNFNGAVIGGLLVAVSARFSVGRTDGRSREQRSNKRIHAHSLRQSSQWSLTALLNSSTTTTTTTTYSPAKDDTSVERRQNRCLLYTNRCYLHCFHQTPNICPFLYKTYSRYHRGHHHNVSIVQQMCQGAEGFDLGAAARQP
jgi:hypothetical protein